MHLSRLMFNPQDSLARRDLASPYELHRTLSSGFEGRDTGRLLFRRGKGSSVLLLSPSPPDFGRALRENRLLSAETKPFELEPEVGQVLRFSLRANPTKKKDGTRIPFVRPENQVAWLERKAVQHGFSLLTVVVVEAGQMKFRKPGKKKSITHYGVDFQGRLRVDDAQLFKQALTEGIGPAKGFGFGLLCVAR